MTEKPQDVGMDAKSRAEQDKIDLNSEMAGFDKGRRKRFFPENSLAYCLIKKKKKAKREFQNLLDMLLAEDPVYAALYKKVTEKLEKAQQAVDLALTDLNQHLEASERKLQLLRNKATELEDGTKVFQSTDNTRIYTEQGKRVSDEKADKIKFSKNAPSWETYQAAKETHNVLLRDNKKLKDYKTDVLETINQRMKDKENPISKEELEDLQTNFPKLPVLETRSLNQSATYKIDSSSATSSTAPNTNQSTNTITPTFEKAHDGILDLAELNAVKPKNTIIPAP